MCVVPSLLVQLKLTSIHFVQNAEIPRKAGNFFESVRKVCNVQGVSKWLEKCVMYRVYQNDWSGFDVDYIHKYGEHNYKY